MTIFGDPNRPAAIKRFEWLQLLALAIYLPILLVAEMTTDEAMLNIAGLAISLFLIFRVSRYGSHVAKWILLVMFGLAVILIPLSWITPLAGMPPMPVSEIIVSIVQLVLEGFSFALLFTASAKEWLAHQRHRPAAA